MEEKEVEVAIRFARLIECHMMLLEHAGKTLVGNVAHAVDGQSRSSLLEQQGTDFDGIDTLVHLSTENPLLHTSEVVDETRCVQNVQSGERIAFRSLSIRKRNENHFSRRIVVVSVDCKHGQGNVQVRILVVDGTGMTGQYHDYSVASGDCSVGRKVKLMSPDPRQYLLRSSMVLFNVLRDGLLASNRSPPRRRKSTCVSSMISERYLLLHRRLQDELERLERIVPDNRVRFPSSLLRASFCLLVSQMVVSGN